MTVKPKLATTCSAKTLVLESPYSTSGCLLPLGLLLNAGIGVADANDANHQPAKDRVGYVFSNDDETTLFRVLGGRAKAGAMSRADFELLSGPRRSELKIIEESRRVPRHVLAHAPTLDARIVGRAKVVLLELHKSPEGLEVLDRFQRTARFDEIPRGPSEFVTYIQRSWDLLQAIGR